MARTSLCLSPRVGRAGELNRKRLRGGEAPHQNGCVYVCTWGPDCERVHDQFDEEDFSLHEEGPWIMSTWHAKEPLSEAIWFALNCTWPDEAFEDECKEVIGIAIANDSWADEIHEAFMRRQELEPLTPRDSSGSIQVDVRFGRRFLLRNCALAIPPGMAFALLWLRGMKTDLTTWLILGFFVVWIAGWMLADFFYFRRYRCPACGGVVRKPSIAKREPGDPIRYKCIPCNTEWDTRLRESGEL